MLNEVPFEIVYSSGEKEPVEFFFDALLESKKFDLGLGFFSSSGINVLYAGFAFFIYNGGNMRIIINDILSQIDKETILFGSSQPDNYFEDIVINNFQILLRTLSKQDEHFFKCLSYLISKKRIEFVATVPTNNKGGIAHNKYGIFYDGVNKVAFNGSANFSKNAFINNIESISCYKSWSGEKNEIDRLLYFENIFQKTWSGHSENVYIIPIQKIKTFIQDRFPVEPIQQIFDNERRLIPERILQLQRIKLKLDLFNKELQKEPSFPFSDGPRKYQITAFKKWKENDFKGIFAMATGTGKTITSLNCILNEYYTLGYYKLLILVPTVALLHQWYSEVKKFNFGNIITTGEVNWFQNIDNILFNSKEFGILNNFIVISTYATFNMSRFQGLLKKYNWEDITLIADEAHNFGSTNSLKKLPIKIKKRIGLSATPHRIYDNAGSQKINEYFNSFPDCYTFNYSMKRAILEERLAKYEYYPIRAYLNYEELKEYKRISEKLIKFYDFKTNSFRDGATKLLIERKRIIHKAKDKLEKLIVLLKNIKDLKYTFIYVPEGKEVDYSQDDESNIKLDNEDDVIIDQYLKAVHDAGYLARKLTSNTKNREEILNQFKNGDLDILLAMKILDEGIDIPITKNAIFCASTGNPRQFIQRRGRVLRPHPDKSIARVYDLIISPRSEELLDTAESIKRMETNIFKSELYRVANFIYTSENQNEVLNGEIGLLAKDYGIDLFLMLNELNEIEKKCINHE
ncbi:MAG: DEAD/DEAH box helicase family protein [Bacteroidales bacterium]|nr:DEAD/DEAH box helicase family protein [Bacteroidales bacterium]